MDSHRLLVGFLLACCFCFPSAVLARPRAIIHVGPHKAGSTFIQENMIRNANVFQRYNYTVIGAGWATETWVVGKYLQRPNQYENPKAKNYLASMRHVQGNVIMSTEALDSISDEGAEILKDTLSKYDVTIVWIHRERTNHLRSLWAESMRWSTQPQPFLSWLPKYLNTNTTNAFNMEANFEVYGEHFGEENIANLSFEGCMNVSNTFAVLLQDVMHLPIAEFTITTGRENPSAPSLYADILYHAVSLSQLQLPERAKGMSIVHHQSLFEYARLVYGCPSRESKSCFKGKYVSNILTVVQSLPIANE